MGLHTKLPIHDAALKLFGVVTNCTLQMRRDAKPTIGRKMLDECLDITTLIQRANIDQDKRPHLSAVLEKKSRIEVLLQTALDAKCISPGQYAQASRWAVSIGQQAIGWRNFEKRPLHDRQGGHASA